MTLRIYGSLALQNQAALQLFDAANGYSVRLQAPASLSTDTTFALPSALGQNDQVLITDASGQFSFAHLADTHIAANAAIALSKLAAVAVGRVIVSDQSGAVSASSITAEQLGSLSGIESNIQAQIDAEKATREQDDGNTLASANTYTDNKVSALVNSAPEVLDTLYELSQALGDDPNFATTVATQIGTAKQDAQNYADTQDTLIKGRLNTLEGTGAGSVSKAAADAEAAAKAYADTLHDNADQRLDTLEGTGVGSVAKAEQDAKSHADGIRDALDIRLDKLEGDASTVGSVAKAEQDAKAYTDNKVAALVNSAPEVLDTLNELAAALGNDANFASTVTTSISGLNSRLSTVEGPDTVTGSIAKAAKDAETAAKAYTDTVVSSHKATVDWLGGNSVTLAHNWNTKDVIVQVYDSSNGQTILTDVSRDANSVTCTSVSSASMWRVIAFNLGPASSSSSSSGGGGGGDTSSGISPFMFAGFDSSFPDQVNWMAYGATTEQVRLEFEMMGIWSTVANLGLASNGVGYAPGPLNNGGTYRLVFTDAMGMAVIGSPSQSFTYQGASTAPVTYSFPLVIGQTDNGDGTITLDWSGGNLPMMQEVQLVKVVGPGMYDAYNGINLGVLTPTSSATISSASVNNSDSYALQTFMGPTATATSASFQIPSGTDGAAFIPGPASGTVLAINQATVEALALDAGLDKYGTVTVAWSPAGAPSEGAYVVDGSTILGKLVGISNQYTIGSVFYADRSVVIKNSSFAHFNFNTHTSDLMSADGIEGYTSFTYVP
jgi:hypothetical protein